MEHGCCRYLWISKFESKITHLKQYLEEHLPYKHYTLSSELNFSPKFNQTRNYINQLGDTSCSKTKEALREVY